MAAATIIGNFNDNEFEGMHFDGINCQVDINVASGNTGTTSRNLFTASNNTIEDPDNNGIQFDFGDQSHSRLICDDNTFDASLNHTSFEFGPQIAIEVEIAHDGTTFTPEVDFFARANDISSTNSGSQLWLNNGIVCRTSSASLAGVGTIRSLIADNVISEVTGAAIVIEADESNVVNAIVRDNTIDSSLSGIPGGTDMLGVIEIDSQSNSDPEIVRVWLDGNETGSDTPGYRIENDTGPTGIQLACEASCPVSGNITTTTGLISLLGHNGNTSGGGGAPTVDASVDFDVITTTAVIGPTLRAATKAEKRAGETLIDKAQVRDVLLAAKLRWVESGLSRDDASLLKSISIGLADYEDTKVGKTWITHITLDRDAAGHGWFLGTKPDAKVPAGCMDLLTVLMHEIGHVLGREHCACDKHLMHHSLKPGMRRLP